MALYYLVKVFQCKLSGLCYCRPLIDKKVGKEQKCRTIVHRNWKNKKGEIVMVHFEFDLSHFTIVLVTILWIADIFVNL